MSFTITGIALRTTRDEKDYTNQDTGEVIPSFTTMVLDKDNYTRALTSNFEPKLEANQEYTFPISVIPYKNKDGKAKIFLKINSEDIKSSI